MPKFDRALSGGKAISGGALGLRSRRGNTNQVDAYWKGGAGGAPLTIEYLVLGGGSGGSNGTTNVNYGSAGASGIIRTSTNFPTPSGSFVITVGAGGTGGTGIRPSGESSVLSTITATGGNGPTTSATGGSNADFAGGTGGGSPQFHGGGGAGAGGSGSAQNGGVGVSSSITGSSLFYGGGGGGGGDTAAGAGGSGVGGTGGIGSGLVPPTSGAINRGSGGGGSQGINSNGANGGSGVVIIAYPNSFSQIRSFAGGLSVTYSAVSRAGFHVYTFTAGTGTISW